MRDILTTNNEAEESFMIRKFLLILLVFITIFSVSFAEGLKLQDDIADVRIYPYSQDDPEGPAYTCAYCYPKIDESEKCATEINTFYDDLITYNNTFANPMMADSLLSMGVETSGFSDISYKLCCNNGEYFSILLRKHSLVDNEETLFYEGHTFAVSGGTPGSTVALPYLLGLLENGESDTWLQERQTQKAEQFTRDLVWEAITEKTDTGELLLWDDIVIDEEYLSYVFFPEEDFYLDENGDPVFFIQPGEIADPSYGLITVPISLEALYDEF